MIIKDFKFPKWMGEHPRHGAPWTDTEDKILRHLYAYGCGVKRLMEITGRNENGVESRLVKFFPDYKRQADLKEEIRLLEATLQSAQQKLADIQQHIIRFD